MRTIDCKGCPNLDKIRGRYYCGYGTPIGKVATCFRLMKKKGGEPMK